MDAQRMKTGPQLTIIDAITYVAYLLCQLIDHALDRGVRQTQWKLDLDEIKKSDVDIMKLLLQNIKETIPEFLTSHRVQELIQKAKTAFQDGSIPNWAKNYVQYNERTLNTTRFDKRYHETIDHMMRVAFRPYEVKINELTHEILQKAQAKNHSLDFKDVENLVVTMRDQCAVTAIDYNKLLEDMCKMQSSQQYQNKDQAESAQTSNSSDHVESNTELEAPQVDDAMPPSAGRQYVESGQRAPIKMENDDLFEGEESLTGGHQSISMDNDIIDLTFSDDEEEKVDERHFRFMTPAPSRHPTPETPEREVTRYKSCPPQEAVSEDTDMLDEEEVDMLEGYQDEERDAGSVKKALLNGSRRMRATSCFPQSKPTTAETSSSSNLLFGSNQGEAGTKKRRRASSRARAPGPQRSMRSMATKWMGSSALCLQTVYGEEEETYMARLRRFATKGFLAKPFPLKGTPFLRICISFFANRCLYLDFSPDWLQDKVIRQGEHVIVRILLSQDAEFTEDGTGKGAKIIIYGLKTNGSVQRYSFKINSGRTVSGQIIQDAIELRLKDKGLK
jgi:hypothetical protein